MKIGIQMLFANHDDYTDAGMYENEIKLGIEADAMGFDFLAPVEHHFTNYSMVPDNTQLLSYMAGVTKQIKLMPAAIILPWNDPLRVVEKITLLDILSEGRAILGMGRGLARREFTGFRLDMSESRERFDEAAAMILEGLETGFVEGNGKFYKQPRVEIRPRPVASFKTPGRAYMVGMSPASVEMAAKLGLNCLKFSNMPWDQALGEVNEYKASYKRYHGREAQPITASDFLSCFTDGKKAVAYKDKYLAESWRSVMNHYEMRGDHFKTSNGSLDSYVEAAAELNKISEQEAMNQWASANLFGTPEEVLEKITKRRDLMGDFDLCINPVAYGMPYEDSFEQLKLFADKVMPVLRSWKGSAGQAAAQ